MTRTQGEGRAALTLDNIPELVNIAEAAEATKLSTFIIRKRIQLGELPAFIPGGREPRKSGRGVGYRIHKTDLQTWFFGAMRGES